MRRPIRTAQSAQYLLLAFASSVSLQIAANESCRPSPAYARPLKAAQEAMKSRLYREALVSLETAASIPERSSCDHFLLGEMFGFTYVRLNDYERAAFHLEEGFKSPHFGQMQMVSRINALAYANYKLKNYDKAIEYGTRSIDVSYPDEEMVMLVSQAYYIKGDYRGAIDFLERQVADVERNGREPKESMLELLLSGSIKLDDEERIGRYVEGLYRINPAKYERMHRLRQELKQR